MGLEGRDRQRQQLRRVCAWAASEGDRLLEKLSSCVVQGEEVICGLMAQRSGSGFLLSFSMLLPILTARYSQRSYAVLPDRLAGECIVACPLCQRGIRELSSRIRGFLEFLLSLPA